MQIFKKKLAIPKPGWRSLKINVLEVDTLYAQSIEAGRPVLGRHRWNSAEVDVLTAVVHFTGRFFRDTNGWYLLANICTLMITKSTNHVGSDTRRNSDASVCHASLRATGESLCDTCRDLLANTRLNCVDTVPTVHSWWSCARPNEMRPLTLAAESPAQIN